MTEENILVPTGITPVSGWRAWRVKDNGIESINYGGLWTPRAALEATCSEALPKPANGGMMYWTSGYTVMSSGMSSTATIPPGHRGGTPILNAPGGLRFVNIGGNTIIPIPDDFKPEPAPAESCSCGVYAAKSKDTARQYARQSGGSTAIGYYIDGANVPVSDDCVVGRVALWGKVIVYTDGWRGQYAYPQSFFVSNSFKRREVLEQFGVPILNVSELGKEAEPVLSGLSISYLSESAEPKKKVKITGEQMRKWRKQGVA